MAMREIRTFELEHGEPAAAWRAAQPLIVKVMAGEIWLTVEGDERDHWLASGESFRLPRGALAWISAGRLDARVALAFEEASAGAPVRSHSRGAWTLPAWFPRWLRTA
jgi:quercetin dioxygenase-like cupin family protein